MTVLDMKLCFILICSNIKNQKNRSLLLHKKATSYDPKCQFKNLRFQQIIQNPFEVHSIPIQTSKMELFTKIMNK